MQIPNQNTITLGSIVTNFDNKDLYIPVYNRSRWDSFKSPEIQ